MRYLVIGDIHGRFDALKSLTAAVPISPSDIVITLGDYVDRGPNSAAVLDWLIARRLSDVPDEHWDFLENGLRPYFETPTHFFVHANAYPDFPLDEQPDYMLYWEQFNDPPPHESGKVMVCGHTPQKCGEPLDLGHAVCIDTWPSGNGWLTCLDIGSGHYWQANQRGEVRVGQLG